MKRIFIVNHLGCGDHVVCNAIYRYYAKRYDAVDVPVLTHNMASVRQMLRDVSQIRLLEVSNDWQMLAQAEIREKEGWDILRLGMFGKDFDFDKWIQCFYKQAGVNLLDRYKLFKTNREDELQDVDDSPFIFMHEDEARGIRIDCKKVTQLRKVRPVRAGSIWKWCGIIEKAKEIHVIDSAFMCMIDLMGLNLSARKVLHRYARNTPMPELRDKWEILN